MEVGSKSHPVNETVGVQNPFSWNKGMPYLRVGSQACPQSPCKLYCSGSFVVAALPSVVQVTAVEEGSFSGVIRLAGKL